MDDGGGKNCLLNRVHYFLYWFSPGCIIALIAWLPTKRKQIDCVVKVCCGEFSLLVSYCPTGTSPVHRFERPVPLFEVYLRNWKVSGVKGLFSFVYFVHAVLFLVKVFFVWIVCISEWWRWSSVLLVIVYTIFVLLIQAQTIHRANIYWRKDITSKNWTKRN